MKTRMRLMRRAPLVRGRMPLDPTEGIERGRPVTLSLDGRRITAYEGESVAAVLVCAGVLATRRTVRGAPRGLYCGMGVCFDCLVVVDCIPNTRACMTLVADGMRVESQDGWGPAHADAVPVVQVHVEPEPQSD